MGRFRDRLRAAPDVILASVTGRHHQLALDGIRDAGLPEPRVLVCDVGTAIREKREGAWRLDTPRDHYSSGGGATSMKGTGSELSAPGIHQAGSCPSHCMARR